MSTATATLSPAVAALPRHAARILLGALFAFASLAYFLELAQPPADLPEGVVAFNAGLAGARYFFPLLKGTELVAAVLLLSNRFVPLALVLLAPIIVNIVLFHTFLAPDGAAMGVVALVLEVGLAVAHREAFRSLLRARA